MACRILLATTVNWPSTARLAGAFSALGCKVDVVFPKDHAVAASRYLHRGFAYRPFAPTKSMADAIRASAPAHVIPCDDRALRHLLALHEFRPLLAHSLGALESYPLMMARARSIAIAREEGVPAPPTVDVCGESSLRHALDKIGLPVVLKSDGSWGGDGVLVARTLPEALRAWRRLSKAPSRLRSMARALLRNDVHFLLDAMRPRRAAVSVQRFIAGKPATSAFACRDGEVLAAIHMDVVAWRGAAGPALLMRRTNCHHMEEAARRIARRFRLSGFHGLDYMRDGDGVAHLIEINPRATQICHLALGAGHDLPAALLGLPPRPTVTAKPLVALFPQTREPNAAVFDDIPWDDPALIEAVVGRPAAEPSRRPAVSAS